MPVSLSASRPRLPVPRSGPCIYPALPSFCCSPSLRPWLKWSHRLLPRSFALISGANRNINVYGQPLSARLGVTMKF